MSERNITYLTNACLITCIVEMGSAEKVLEAANRIVGEKAGMPYLSMGGEDFAYYLQKVPGCFFFVGSAPNEKELFETPHHCSHFNMDEKALLIGSSVYLNLIDNIMGI